MICYRFSQQEQSIEWAFQRLKQPHSWTPSAPWPIAPFPALGAELAQQLPRGVVEDGIAAYEEGQLCQVLSGTVRDGQGTRDGERLG